MHRRTTPNRSPAEAAVLLTLLAVSGCGDDNHSPTDGTDPSGDSATAPSAGGTADEDDGPGDGPSDGPGDGPTAGPDDGTGSGPGTESAGGSDDGDSIPPEGSSGCDSEGAQTGAWQATIDVPGVGERGFHVSIPEPYDASVPHKLYIAVHGTGWTGEMIRPYYDIESVPGGAGDELFIYPDRDPGFSNLETNGEQGEADLAYIDAVLDWARGNYCVDDNRIFAMGHSGGGNFVTFLSCRRGGTLRAVVPTGTGGAWWYDGLSQGDVSQCEGAVAAMVVHGRQDAVIPYDPWGLETLDYFRTLNGCGTGNADAVPGTECMLMEGCVESFDCSHDELTDFGDGHQIPSWYRTGVMDWLRSL